ncbi:MAG TPA: acyl-CoA dehydrogenase [Candidatus Marinimicrobia bacterium]|jgi:alkylation response protein AidB-like acyl-CoA dehydrogenase|nr:acyl-CoA dehydrogenase [Candidatus Neomarinimicrobiota bacterium]
MHFLSEEQELVRNTARKFAEKHLKPGVIERDENAEFPSEQVKMMGELGFMGIMVPEKWNGAGMDTISYTLIIEELSRVDASAGVIVSVNNSLVCQIIVNYGNDWQKETYLKKLAGGRQLGAFSLSEPQSGSDASNLHTVAEKSGQYYIINGTKNWVTSGINSDVVIVMALTDKSAGYNGISTFIVPKDLDGFLVGQKEDKLGIRGSDTCELYFDNCRIPIENLIDKEGQGFRIALATLDGGRIGIAAQALGIAQAALDKSVQYAKERKQFGKTIGSFGAIQEKIALMGTNVEASRLLIQKAAVLKDAHKPYTKAAAMAKSFASQTAMDATIDCVQIFGGYGYMQEYGVERLMRDAKITQIYEGTTEIQQMVIAREIMEN